MYFTLLFYSDVQVSLNNETLFEASLINYQIINGEFLLKPEKLDKTCLVSIKV